MLHLRQTLSGLSSASKGFAVKDVVEGMEYEFRVSAINNSGAGEFSTPSEFVFARDPKSRWTVEKTTHSS